MQVGTAAAAGGDGVDYVGGGVVGEAADHDLFVEFLLAGVFWAGAGDWLGGRDGDLVGGGAGWGAGESVVLHVPEAEEAVLAARGELGRRDEADSADGGLGVRSWDGGNGSHRERSRGGRGGGKGGELEDCDVPALTS